MDISCFPFLLYCCSVFSMALYLIAHLIGMETDEMSKAVITSERRIAEEEERDREDYRNQPVQIRHAQQSARFYEVTVDGETYQTYENPDFNSRIHIDGEGYVDKVGGSEYTSSYRD